MLPKFKHFTSTSQFTSAAMLEEFLDEVDARLNYWDYHGRPAQTAENKIMGMWFAEPSTRTRMSCETAMKRLGGNAVTETNPLVASSVAKGECWADTVRTMSRMHDIIVCRTAKKGQADEAAAVSSVPVINAGDGDGEHPTQGLLDAYTIYRHFGRLDSISIGLVGDLKHSRCVHSLLKLTGLYSKVTYHVLPALGCHLNPAEYLQNPEAHTRVHKNIDELVDTGVDVVYMTRCQSERHHMHPDRLYDPKLHYLTLKRVERLPDTSIVMHPFPRGQEIPFEVDGNPRAVYFDQIQNGLYIRMALIAAML